MAAIPPHDPKEKLKAALMLVLNANCALRAAKDALLALKLKPHDGIDRALRNVGTAQTAIGEALKTFPD